MFYRLLLVDKSGVLQTALLVKKSGVCHDLCAWCPTAEGDHAGLHATADEGHAGQMQDAELLLWITRYKQPAPFV